MMKKLVVFAFVTALIVAFSLPAFAYTVEGAKGERFTIGGSLCYDIGYRNIDKDRSTTVPDIRFPANTDNTYFFMGVSTSSYLFVNFTVGDISGFFSMYSYVSPGAYHSYSDNRVMGPSTVFSSYSINNTSASFANLNNNLAADLWYGTYTFGNFSLQAGKLPALTVQGVPMARLGYLSETGGHIDAIAYGYVYENKMVALRFNHYVNKMFRWSFQLIAPPVYGENASTVAAPAAGTPVTVGQSSNFVLRDSYADYPAIGGLAAFTFGPAMVAPGFAYAYIKWAGLPAGFTDNMSTWFVRLPVKLTFGPFVAFVEGLYGQNLGSRTSNNFALVSSESADSMYKRSATGQIQDANTLNVWTDIAYTFGPVTPHIYAGFTKYTNDKAFIVPGTKHESGRTFYGINAWYKVTPNFTIVPEFSMYDLGDVPNSNVKLGKDWLLGVQFQFNF